MLHHSNNVTQDNSVVCFCCLSLPYKSRVYLLAQGPRIKEHVWRCTSCRAPLEGGRPRILPVTQTALHLLLGCGTRWDRDKHPQPACPPGAHTAQQDPGPPQSIAGHQKAEGDHLQTQEAIQEFNSWNWGSTDEKKKSLTPWMLEPAALPVLAPGLWHFLIQRAVCLTACHEHQQPQCKQGCHDLSHKIFFSTILKI